MSGAEQVEIERKWVLRELPARLVACEAGHADPQVERVRLRQGYLRPPTDAEVEAFAASSSRGHDPGPIRFGRLRAVESASGTRHLHTVKSGQGLVRREIERPIDEEAFRRSWPETEGRRIEKTRWLVRENGAGGIWEIDRFDAIDLVLAEIEAPDEAAAAAIRIPDWLAPVVAREVTHEPAFTNAEIALRLGLGG